MILPLDLRADCKLRLAASLHSTVEKAFVLGLQHQYCKGQACLMARKHRLNADEADGAKAASAI